MFCEKNRKGLRKYYFIIPVFLLIASFTEASQSCNFKSSDYIEELKNIESVLKIDVDIKKSRKWAKNGLKIVTDRSENIKPERKKRFSGKVSVFYDFGSCTYDAKIRQNGDWKDHLDFSNGQLLQSLDVGLKEGNIAGFVDFKLLLPATRHANNEVIITTLLQELDFLAPRTKMLPVSINGVDSVMLMQEKPAKEFLEQNLRREGPMFEGDESLLWGWQDAELFSLERVSLSRLTNAKWASRGSSSLAMSANALTILQTAYMKYANRSGRVFIDPVILGNGLEDMAAKWKAYDTLLIASGGTHALRPHNRKYYWNALIGAFEPIYYDGNISFKLFENSFMTDQDFSLYASRIKESDFDHLEKKLTTISISKVTKKINSLGVKITERESEKIILKIRENLSRFEEILSASDKNNDDISIDPKMTNTFQEKVFNLVPEGQVIRLALSEGNHTNYRVQACNKDGCKDWKGNNIWFSKMMKGHTALDAKTIFVLGTKKEPYSDRKNYFFDDKNIEITASAGMTVLFIKDKNQLILKQTSGTDWALIHSSNLKKTQILFEGTEGKNMQKGSQQQRFNQFGLTGCLTIYASTLTETMIQARGGYCEDTVNFVNSTGSILELNVQNSFADAVDIDFSTLEIKSIHVLSAGNDCLDVSTGNYRIIDAKIKNCGDKGISVGEGSMLQATNIEIENVKIGVSSKDSSVTKIHNLMVDGTSLCGEAYRKKQEFHGAILEVDNTSCTDSNFSNDISSKILLNGILQ